jgi:hypothetical protein
VDIALDAIAQDVGDLRVAGLRCLDLGHRSPLSICAVAPW